MGGWGRSVNEEGWQPPVGRRLDGVHAALPSLFGFGVIKGWTLIHTPPLHTSPAALVAEWVRSYSSTEYLRLPAKAERILDEAADAEAYGATMC